MGIFQKCNFFEKDSYLFFLFIIFPGVVKDYFIAAGKHNGKPTMFWCSSGSWVFSELPKPVSNPKDLEKIKSINNLFTGEFDSVLFKGSGDPEVINAELGIVLQPKPLTELDRLSYVMNQI